MRMITQPGHPVYPAHKSEKHTDE